MLLWQEQVSRQGEQSIRFYILFLLGFMSGLEAGSGSRPGAAFLLAHVSPMTCLDDRFLTAQRAENVIEADRGDLGYFSYPKSIGNDIRKQHLTVSTTYCILFLLNNKGFVLW